MIDQRSGFFIHALNLSKKNATGDLMLFTDDDAIPPPKWIEKIPKAPSSPPPGGRHSQQRHIHRPAGNEAPPHPGRQAVVREAAPPTEEIQAWRIPHKNLDVAYGPHIPDR